MKAITMKQKNKQGSFKELIAIAATMIIAGVIIGLSIAYFI